MGGDPRLGLLEDPIALGRALGYVGLTEELHGAGVRFALGTDRCWIEWPRGHYKSTLWSIVMPIWFLARDPSSRVMLMSAALSLVQDFIEQINTLLIGDLRFEDGVRMPVSSVFPWLGVSSYHKRNGLNVLGRSGNNPDHSIFPMAVGSAAAGRHPTIIITDDLSNEQNSKSLAQREKVVDSYSTLTPLAKTMDCPIYSIGTPWELGDFSCHMKGTLKVPVFRRHVWGGRPRPDRPDQFRADRVDAARGWTGWPLDPDIMSADQIEAIEDPSSDKYVPFHRRSAWYYCEPVAGDFPVFGRELVHSCHRYELESGGLEARPGYEIALVQPAQKPDRHHNHSGIILIRVVTAGDLGCDSFFPPLLNIYGVVAAEVVPNGAEGLLARLRALPEERPDLRAVLVDHLAYTASVGPWLTAPLPRGIVVRGLSGTQSQTDRGHRAMGLAAAMGEGRFALPTDFPGKVDFIRALTEYNHQDGNPLVDAASLISILPRLGRISTEAASEPGRLPKRKQTARKWGL